MHVANLPNFVPICIVVVEIYFFSLLHDQARPHD